MPPNRTAAAQPQQQIEKRERPLIERLRGSETNPRYIEAKLREAAANFHLVSPAPTAGELPEGCVVVFSPILIDVEHETYAIPGDSSKRGLSKVALDRIAGAAAVGWMPELSRRLDDGSDPHYCHYKAVGRVRHFDGSVLPIQGEKEMDLREGSPQVRSLIEKSAKKAKRENKALNEAQARAIGEEKSFNQVNEMRLHILAHAETKARLRAIRSIGVRTSYGVEELERPFVVARVMFTGRSEDPELRRMFASKIADSFLGGTAALFGAPPTTAAALPAPVAVAGSLHAPPPVSRASIVDDDLDDVVDAPSTTVRQGPAQQAPVAAKSSDEADLRAVQAEIKRRESLESDDDGL